MENERLRGAIMARGRKAPSLDAWFYRRVEVSAQRRFQRLSHVWPPGLSSMEIDAGATDVSLALVLG